MELGHHEGVAAFDRVDVQEGVGVFVLKDLEGGDFAFNDFAEETIVHSRLLLNGLAINGRASLHHAKLRRRAG